MAGDVRNGAPAGSSQAAAPAVALGLDIGGTKIAAGIVDRAGKTALRAVVATPARGGAHAVLAASIALAGQVIAKARASALPLRGIGIGTGGHVDHARGIVTYASDLLPGWAGTDLAVEMSAATGLPVVVDNDVNALALGEARFGAGRPYSDALYVAVGTGIGGALVLSGRLWRGATWTGGELGHLLVDWDGARICSCGRPGHLEAYCCGPALAMRYWELCAATDGSSRDDSSASAGPLDLRDVAERARQGDRLARQAIEEGAHVLGLGLGGLLNVLDPQVLIVGGGVAELGDLWWAPLEAALRANPMPGPACINIRRAALGVDAALIGAACLVFEAD